MKSLEKIINITTIKRAIAPVVLTVAAALYGCGNPTPSNPEEENPMDVSSFSDNNIQLNTTRFGPGATGYEAEITANITGPEASANPSSQPVTGIIEVYNRGTNLTDPSDDTLITTETIPSMENGETVETQVTTESLGLTANASLELRATLTQETDEGKSYSVNAARQVEFVAGVETGVRIDCAITDFTQSLTGDCGVYDLNGNSLSVEARGTWRMLNQPEGTSISQTGGIRSSRQLTVYDHEWITLDITAFTGTDRETTIAIPLQISESNYEVVFGLPGEEYRRVTVPQELAESFRACPGTEADEVYQLDDPECGLDKFNAARPEVRDATNYLGNDITIPAVYVLGPDLTQVERR
jgi:hypothetical protein